MENEWKLAFSVDFNRPAVSAALPHFGVAFSPEAGKMMFVAELETSISFSWRPVRVVEEREEHLGDE